MKRLYFLVLMLFCMSFAAPGATNKNTVHKVQSATLIQLSSSTFNISVTGDSVKGHRRNKFIAALAFPLIGVLGLHRAYLGTSAGVPFVYIATFGGAFGILPFVDFVLILLSKDVNTYAHKPTVFMWRKK